MSWPRLALATEEDPRWLSLPGYPDAGIPDLVGLQVPIEVS